MDKAEARHIYLAALKAARRPTPDSTGVAAMLRQAAKLGSHEATFALATWHLFGKHFSRDVAKGIRLLKKAARAGNADACFDLAISYDNALGVLRDPQLAFELYLESAMRGNVEAHTQVARCFWSGRGVKRNRVLAGLWEDEHDRLLKPAKRASAESRSRKLARQRAGTAR